MLRVGITGGIGSGKSALTDWLSQKGIVIIDADLASRVIVAPGQPALAEIADTFGREYIRSNGQLNRGALRELVFTDYNKRQKLEAITHPRIQEEIWRQMSTADSAYVVLSSPLLLESGQSSMVDLSVVVDVPESTQLERTMTRDNNARKLVKGIMAAQLDRNTRISRADIVIDNSGSLDEFYQRGEVLHQTLLARASKH